MAAAAPAVFTSPSGLESLSGSALVGFTPGALRRCTVRLLMLSAPLSSSSFSKRPSPWGGRVVAPGLKSGVRVVDNFSVTCSNRGVWRAIPTLLKVSSRCLACRSLVARGTRTGNPLCRACVSARNSLRNLTCTQSGRDTTS